MKGQIGTKRLRIGFIVIFILCAILLMPRTAYAQETKLTDELRAEILARIDKAYEAGEPEADISDLNIIVNMYSDKIGKVYQQYLDLCSEYSKDRGYFMMGSHRESYFAVDPRLEETDECNEYGIGPNRIVSMGLWYDPYYRKADGTVDKELIARTQEKLTREYELALSVVSEDMTDVEKALALYDYIIAMSNYPETESIDSDGKEVYDPESYSAISVFRDHISVCAANAEAYCYLLSDCNIPCILLDSTGMEHSWTMVKVNGEWYHADPTWDNPRYMDGFTSCGDPNDDIWDLGACGHTYFLKSDEEMINNLQHYGWKVAKDFSDEQYKYDAPESGPSGSFDDTFFGGTNWMNDVHYNYVNGEWYFLEWMSNRIAKTTYGAEPGKADFIDAPSENSIKYVYSAGDCLFICERDGIWRYDTVKEEMSKLPLTREIPQNGEPVFTEMNIAHGYLNGVVLLTDAIGASIPTPFSYPVEEMFKIETAPETEEAQTTEEPASEEDTSEEPSTEPATTLPASSGADTDEAATAESGKPLGDESKDMPAQESISAQASEDASQYSGGEAADTKEADGSGSKAAVIAITAGAVCIGCAAVVFCIVRKRKQG